jgi:hypothetical protein
MMQRKTDMVRGIHGKRGCVLSEVRKGKEEE